MRPPVHLPPEVLWRASLTHGAVLAEDLESCGVFKSRRHRACELGLLRPVVRGAFGVAAQWSPTTRLAGVQLVHPNVVAERRTAAALWQLDGFRPAPGATDDLVLDLVTSPERRTRLRECSVRVASIPSEALAVEAGITLTSPAWTLADLGACPGIDVDDVEVALESALRRGLVEEAAIRAFAASPPLEVARGARALADALARRRPGCPPTESYAETRFLQRVVRPSGLADPERQVPIRIDGRPAPLRADFLFGGILVVEIDGDAWHGADRDDGTRDHLLRVAGHPTLRIRAGVIEGRPAAARGTLMRELGALRLI